MHQLKATIFLWQSAPTSLDVISSFLPLFSGTRPLALKEIGFGEYLNRYEHIVQNFFCYFSLFFLGFFIVLLAS